MPTLSLSRQWAAVVGVCFTLLAAERPATAADLSRIETIVVLYAENRSFDHLYGLFPGANGIANATREQTTQRDHDGRVLPYLRVWDSHGKPDPSFPELPTRRSGSTRRRSACRADQVLLSPIHAYYHNIEQINGGRNDMFAAMSTVGGYTMGYFDGSQMKLWQWAKEFTLADNFFMGAFGGSYLNHQWLICACTPVFKDAPPSACARGSMRNGKLEKKPNSPSARDGAVQTYTGGLGGQVTPDGFSVNTTQPPYQPSGIPPRRGRRLDLADAKGNERLGLPLPPQTNQDDRRHTIGQGRQLGMVCGRLEGGPRRWHAPARREAKRDLYA